MAKPTKPNHKWQNSEINYLLQLIHDHHQVICSKETHQRANEAKKDAWKAVNEKFTQRFGAKWTVAQMKELWKRQRISAKKEFGEYKRKIRQTGGGPPPSPLKATTILIKEILPYDFVQLQNPYDDDVVLENDEAISALEFIRGNKKSSSSTVTDDAIYDDDDPVKDDIPHSRSSLPSVAADANYMHDTVHDLLDDEIPQYSNQSASTSRPFAASDSSTRFEENQRSVTPAKRNSTSQGQGRKKAKMTAEEVLIEISKEEHALRMKYLQEEHQLKIQFMREEHALKMEIMNLEKSTMEVKYKGARGLNEKKD
ncbi:uncharacterized protein LOC121413180 [Lytechinus variegatus]|uniref:uncharacterized protein LOC121413180 n=1 Tax=Lytechinus variegatus TaxID=7654 RepID=UPI001BB1FBF7|nr:uncharacterized protein LOC121413180 [Lytechinus variegatus]